MDKASTLRFPLLLVLVGGLVAECGSRAAVGNNLPKPYGPTPSPRQLQWHSMEFYGLVHFGMNTFTDREWGTGDESPGLFNPTAFDARQIARVAKEAGMGCLILVCKHHDGFCLWPSRFTEHSVKRSTWKQGQGDVVREFADACRAEGLKFGVYLSPWDMNQRDYGRPEYVGYYRNLLRELLTNYGDIFIAWFDGACGGRGYYGGAPGERRVDSQTYYGWADTWSLVRSLQPGAVIFSDAGPDVRWAGDERGYVADPCWATISLAGCYPGMTNIGALGSGQRWGTNWVPAECDVPLRATWFYHAAENRRVKTPAQLLDIYYRTVGRGAGLDLGLAPDLRGLMPDMDAAALREMGRVLRLTFATNFAARATATASNTRGNEKAFAPGNAIDGSLDTFWANDDAITNSELLVDLGAKATFNVVRLREYLPLGQRIDAFALDEWQEGNWREFARGIGVGSQRLLRVHTTTTDRVRLRITQAAACPALAEFALYHEPEQFRLNFNLPGPAQSPSLMAPKR